MLWTMMLVGLMIRVDHLRKDICRWILIVVENCLVENVVDQLCFLLERIFPIVLRNFRVVYVKFPPFVYSVVFLPLVFVLSHLLLSYWFRLRLHYYHCYLTTGLDSISREIDCLPRKKWNERSLIEVMNLIELEIGH